MVSAVVQMLVDQVRSMKSQNRDLMHVMEELRAQLEQSERRMADLERAEQENAKQISSLQSLLLRSSPPSASSSTTSSSALIPPSATPGVSSTTSLSFPQPPSPQGQTMLPASSTLYPAMQVEEGFASHFFSASLPPNPYGTLSQALPFLRAYDKSALIISDIRHLLPPVAFAASFAIGLTTFQTTLPRAAVWR
jgi:TolA-binding protein